MHCYAWGTVLILKEMIFLISLKEVFFMTTIKISGMSCQHCVMAVTKALQRIDGIRNVQVNLDKGEAMFDEERPIDSSTVREAVRKAGFDVA